MGRCGQCCISLYTNICLRIFFVFRHFQLSGGEILSSEWKPKDDSSRTVGRSNSVTLGCLTLSEVKMQLALSHEVFFFFFLICRKVELCSHINSHLPPQFWFYPSQKPLWRKCHHCDVYQSIILVLCEVKQTYYPHHLPITSIQCSSVFLSLSQFPDTNTQHLRYSAMCPRSLLLSAFWFDPIHSKHL